MVRNTIVAILLITLLGVLSACTSPFMVQNDTNVSQDVVVQAEPAVSEEVDTTAPEEELLEEEIVEEAPLLEEVENRTASHYVNLVEGGFEIEEITIKVGETVAWKNEREGYVNKAMILGTKQCQPIRSGIFMPGEVFRWTFTKAETCVIVDGIYTTEMMNVIVQ